MPGFLRDYPAVTLDFSLSDRLVDLVADGFDLALRIAQLEDSSLIARRLCMVRLLLVASPSYLDTHGRPTHPAQLGSHHAFAYTGGFSPGLWRFAHRQFGEETVQPPGRIWTDNSDMLNPALPIPAWQADGLIEDYAHYHRGEAATVTSGVEGVTGFAPRSFSDFARDFAAAFQTNSATDENNGR